jgi:hypothetical protein
VGARDRWSPSPTLSPPGCNTDGAQRAIVAWSAEFGGIVASPSVDPGERDVVGHRSASPGAIGRSLLITGQVDLVEGASGGESSPFASNGDHMAARWQKMPVGCASAICWMLDNDVAPNEHFTSGYLPQLDGRR